MFKVVRTISPPLGFGKNCPYRVACKVWCLPMSTPPSLCIIPVGSFLPDLLLTFLSFPSPTLTTLT